MSLENETDGFDPDRFAIFDNERWTGSDTYLKTTGEERRLLAPFFLWQSQNGPIPDDAFVLYRIAWADEREAGPEFLARVRATLSKAFTLRSREWWNKTAIAAWSKHHDKAQKRIEKAVKAGLASARARAERAQAEPGVELRVEPVVEQRVQLPSTSTSTSTSAVVDKQESQVSLFEPIEPPKGDARAREIVEAFLVARHMRLHGTTGNRRAPSEGMIQEGARKVKALLALGYERELIVSLPALVEDKTVPNGGNLLDMMLRGEPFVLLKTENKNPDSKCHARRYEAALNGQFLSDRQVAILRNLGTYEYVRSRGAKDRSDAR